MSGELIGEGLDADDDERALALLALEPRQRRVDPAALVAGSGGGGCRGLHIAARQSRTRALPIQRRSGEHGSSLQGRWSTPQENRG
jgi:hypothetical protein